MRYTHILFDHDGVLVDTEHLYFKATQEILAELGVELTMPVYLELQARGENAWTAVRDAAPDLETGEQAVRAGRSKRNERYQALIMSEDIDIPGVGEVLLALGELCHMAIVTTAKQCDFDLIHRDRSIVPHMDFVLTNKDYPRSKPHPDPYVAALERYGLGEPGRALVVEDSERGLRAAVAAGLDCAVVAHPFTASQDFSTARYRIDALDELVAIVKG